MQGMAKALAHHRASVGILAVAIGISLGIGVVYLDQREIIPAHAQGGGSCQQQEEACGRVNGQGHSAACHSQWVQCVMKKCSIGGTGAGQCSQDPDCQNACTEESTSTGGKISCCSGTPIHNNPCKDKVDGKCNPKQTELGKEKGKEEGKGGEMPKLPEMPKGGGGEQKPQTDPCAQNASSSECQSTQTLSGVSGFLSNLFGTNENTESTGTNSVSSALQSAASKLQSFLSGESTPTTETTNTVNNPTEAVVTPVTPSASQAGQVTSQSGSSQQGSNAGGTAGIGNTVTGFAGGGAQADAGASAGIMTAISQTLAGIGVTLRNLWGGLF